MLSTLLTNATLSKPPIERHKMDPMRPVLRKDPLAEARYSQMNNPYANNPLHILIIFFISYLK